jgi:integrase
VPRIRFHDLRHTAASVMIGRGIPLANVAAIMGHSLNILNDIYVHFIPGTMCEAARVMDEVLSPIEAPDFFTKG